MAPRIRRSSSLMSNLPAAMTVYLRSDRAPNCSDSLLIPAKLAVASWSHLERRALRPASPRDQRGRCLAAQHLQKVAVLLDREDNYRKSIVASKGDGSPVHHLEVAGQDLRIRQPVVTHRMGNLFGVGRIDTVHLRRLCQRLAVHFHGPQCGRGIRGKEGVTGPG